MKNSNFAQSAADHIDNTNEFMRTALENFEKVTKLQFEASKKILDEVTSACKEMTLVSNPKDFFDRCKDLTTTTTESGMCNYRNICNIAAEAHSHVTKFIENNIQNAQQHISNTIEDLSKFTPNNNLTEPFKGMINGANQAMNTMSQMTSQVSKFASDNIKAATSASINAVKKTTSTSTKQ